MMKRTKYNWDTYVNTVPYLKKNRDAYRKREAELNDAFKADLFELHGVSDNPKREAAYRIAWEEGHAAGYGEIASYFDDLVELIK